MAFIFDAVKQLELSLEKVMGLFEDEGEANVKYEDGKIKRVALERLRPHEKVTKALHACCQAPRPHHSPIVHKKRRKLQLLVSIYNQISNFAKVCPTLSNMMDIVGQNLGEV